jgi:hypothetical protein
VMHFSGASAGDERCFDVLFRFEAEGVKLYSVYSIERVYTYAHNSIPKKIVASIRPQKRPVVCRSQCLVIASTPPPRQILQGRSRMW